MSDVGSARRAKDELKQRIGAEPWCVGIGVEREDGVGFIVRVTVKKGARATYDALGIAEHIGPTLVKVLEED